MPVGSHIETITVEGRMTQRNADKTADNNAAYGGASAPITLAAGKAATNWVKTDLDTAACDLPAGHGYGDGASNCDVYWDVGARYGVVVTITTNAAALEGGTGTDFPASAETTVVVCKQQQSNVSIDGDQAALVGVVATVDGYASFQDASSNVIRGVALIANEPDMWDSSMATNPYTGNPITKALVSNGALAWETSKAYTIGKVVTQTSLFYKCLVAHTSGTFATDLAAGDWVLVTATFEVIVLQDSTP